MPTVAHNPATMMQQVGALSARWGRLALWLMPLTIVYEWVGGTFYKTALDRTLYLSLFLALFWLTDLTPSPPVELGRLRKPLGALLLALGAGMLGTSFCWLFGARLGLRFEPPAFLGTETRRLLLPILAAWPLALGSSLLREPRIGARSYEQLGSFVALAFMMHVAAGVRVQALPILTSGDQRWLPTALALGLLALAVIPRGSARLRLGLIVAAGFLFRLRGMAVWAIDPRVRDMLALVESAQDRFASGQNPYVFYAMQHGSELPLTYFPGLWLGYGVPRLLGLDLRWMGALGEAGFLLLLGLLARKVELPRRAWAEAFVGCFAAVWLFSPSAAWNAIYAEPTLWWGLLGLLFALGFSSRFAAGAVVLGYAVATRHFAIVLAPFVLLYVIRARGLRAALPYLALSASVAALLLVPFVLADPELFWFGSFRWLREYGPAHIDWFFDRFGFMQYFHEQGLLAQMPLVQWGLVMLCFVGALLSKRLARIPSFAATASLLFIMLNILLWDSFLLDGAVTAAGLVIARPQLEALRLGKLAPTSAPVLRLSIATLGVVALFGVYLAYTLVSTLHPPGRQDTHDFMVSAVRQGDFVIDRSDRRVAFVQGRWLLRREEVPAPIGGELYDGAWGGGSALAAPGRVWLVTQETRDLGLRRSFAQLGKQVESHSIGAFRVQAIAPYRPRALQVPALAPGVGLQRCQLGWTQAEMLGVQVKRDAPVVLTFEKSARALPLLVAAGFPNGDVVWPRADVQVRLLGAAASPELLEVRNLGGVQWRTVPAREVTAQGELRVELSTSDPVGRLLCLELLELP